MSEYSFIVNKIGRSRLVALILMMLVDSSQSLEVRTQSGGTVKSGDSDMPPGLEEFQALSMVEKMQVFDAPTDPKNTKFKDLIEGSPLLPVWKKDKEPIQKLLTEKKVEFFSAIKQMYSAPDQQAQHKRYTEALKELDVNQDVFSFAVNISQNEYGAWQKSRPRDDMPEAGDPPALSESDQKKIEGLRVEVKTALQTAVQKNQSAEVKEILKANGISENLPIPLLAAYFKKPLVKPPTGGGNQSSNGEISGDSSEAPADDILYYKLEKLDGGKLTAFFGKLPAEEKDITVDSVKEALKQADAAELQGKVTPVPEEKLKRVIAVLRRHFAAGQRPAPTAKPRPGDAGDESSGSEEQSPPIQIADLQKMIDANWAALRPLWTQAKTKAKDSPEMSKVERAIQGIAKAPVQPATLAEAIAYLQEKHAAEGDGQPSPASSIDAMVQRLSEDQELMKRVRDDDSQPAKARMFQIFREQNIQHAFDADELFNKLKALLLSRPAESGGSPSAGSKPKSQASPPSGSTPKSQASPPAVSKPKSPSPGPPRGANRGTPSGTPSHESPTNSGDDAKAKKAHFVENCRAHLGLSDDTKLKDFVEGHDGLAGRKKAIQNLMSTNTKLSPFVGDERLLSAIYNKLWEANAKNNLAAATSSSAKSSPPGKSSPGGHLQQQKEYQRVVAEKRAAMQKTMDEENAKMMAAAKVREANEQPTTGAVQPTASTSQARTAKPKAVGAISTDGASPAGSGGSTPPSSAKDKSNQNAGGNQATDESKGGFACFPADAIVHVSDGFTVVPKKMSDLQVGDSVETSSGFEEISTFLHRNDEITATFVSLAFDDASVSNLNATHNHRIFLADGTSKQIGAVKIGDVLVHNEGAITVTAISSYDDRGIYAPMTASGSIVVNGVAASTLAQGPEGAVFQSIATMFLTPAKYLNWFFTPSAPKVANIHSAAALGTITHSQ